MFLKSRQSIDWRIPGRGNPGPDYGCPVILKGNPGVAVGTEVTLRPPHRSVHAGLPHTAPASGHDAKRTVG